MAKIDIARDFLTAHLEQRLLKRIDLNSLKLEPNSFIDETHKELRSDILYSANIDKHQGFIYCLIEQQSTIDKLMAFRLLQYCCRIWQMYLDKQKKKSQKLPTILPLVLYSGAISPYSYSTKLLDCFIEPILIQDYVLNQFKLLDLTIIPDEELARHQRAAFMEILQKHIRARDIIPIIEFVCNADVLGKIENIENGKYLYFALKYLINMGESPDINKAIKLIANKLPEKEKNIMTIAEGLKKQGKLEVARNLIAMGMNPRDVAKATKLPLNEIKSLN